jgi:hypothetical protein
MTGVILLLIFVAVGNAISFRIIPHQTLVVKTWLGTGIGIFGLMWLVVPFSFFLGFTPLSHLLALALMLLLYLFVRHKTSGSNTSILKLKKDTDIDPSLKLNTGKTPGFIKGAAVSSSQAGENVGFPYKTFVLVTFPLFILSIILLNNHILQPSADGALYGGQSTYGDLSLHLGIITSIGEQGIFPPGYSIFPGQRLCYPFLVNSLSSSLYIFGTPLRWAVLIPSYILFAMVLAGFFILAYEILRDRHGAAISYILFFLNGGFGFIYFLDLTKEFPQNFKRIFTDWYKTPTNFNDMNIRWSNVIADMLIPQRTTLGGWAILFMVLWLLYKAVNSTGNIIGDADGHNNEHSNKSGNTGCHISTNNSNINGNTDCHNGTNSINNISSNISNSAVSDVSKKISVKLCSIRLYFLAAGLAAGLLPMIHTHSYMAAGLIAFSWFAVFMVSEKDKKACFINWLWFFIPAGLLSLPQLFYWTFAQSTGEGFVRLHLNWVNEMDNWLWFWIKNVGMVFLLLPAALKASGKRNLLLYSGPALIFVLSSIIVFQPNIYDNNKLLYIWYVFSAILAGNYLVMLYRKLKGLPGRTLLAVLAIVLCTLSAVLTLGREMVSGGKYMQYSSADIKAAEFIKETTPADALFLTGDQHLNPVSALAGRNILSGTPLYLYFHGVDYQDRAADVEKMYRDTGALDELSEKYKIDYIYISSYERTGYDAKPDVLRDIYPVVYEDGGIMIFAVSSRAQGDIHPLSPDLNTNNLNPR